MDLAALLADPARVGAVPDTELVAALEAVTAQGARLETVRTLLAVRLATVAAPANGHHDVVDLVTDIGEVARLARRSVSWVRKNGHTLPGFTQPGGKRTKVAWSRQALEAWATSPGMCPLQA